MVIKCFGQSNSKSIWSCSIEFWKTLHMIILADKKLSIYNTVQPLFNSHPQGSEMDSGHLKGVGLFIEVEAIETDYWSLFSSALAAWKGKEDPWVDFLIVIMASDIARGGVHTTTMAATMKESCNLAVILQILGWERHAALVYRVLLWYWTTMLWSIDTCQNKVSADQYRVTISRAQVSKT